MFKVGPRHVCQPLLLIKCVPSNPDAHPLGRVAIFGSAPSNATFALSLISACDRAPPDKNLHIRPKPSRKYASSIRKRVKHATSTLPTQGWVSNLVVFSLSPPVAVSVHGYCLYSFLFCCAQLCPGRDPSST